MKNLDNMEFRALDHGYKYYVSANHHVIVDPEGSISEYYGFAGRYAWQQIQKEINQVVFFTGLSAATKKAILTGLYADLNNLMLMDLRLTAVRTSKMIAILEKCF